MAGFREFVTGEVLTASNVDDFLMKQTVQKYADAAARDAALGTAVAGGNALREGMIAYLDDTDEVIAYDGSAWNPVAPEPPAGIGTNAVTASLTTGFVTSSSSFVNVTGLTATITPTSATSKVLVIAQVVHSLNLGGAGVTGYGFFRVARDGSATYQGDAINSNTRAVFGGFLGVNLQDLTLSGSIAFLDSPATTSATTYAVQARRSTDNSAYINRARNLGATASYVSGASSITVIEVAA